MEHKYFKKMERIFKGEPVALSSIRKLIGTILRTINSYAIVLVERIKGEEY